MRETCARASAGENVLSFSYIEVFKSTYAEARQAIMNDSQAASRQRAQPQRANGYENYQPYNGPQGTNFPVGTGIKRPMTISFNMKIRGVPFEAGEKDVFEVRERNDVRLRHFSESFAS